MNKEMTKQQINWAKSHDWYLGIMFKHGQVYIFVQDDMNAHNELEFTSFEKLYIWAGY